MFNILGAGKTGWWVPDAKMHHIVPAGRQTREYIYKYFIAMGETMAYLLSGSPGTNHMWRTTDPAPVSASALVLHRRRVRSALRYVLARLKRDQIASVDALREIGFFSGGLAFLQKQAASS